MVGAGGLPGGDGWLVIAPADAAPLLFGEPAEITMTPVHDAVLAALDGGGALFFRALGDRVAAELRGGGATAAALGLTDQTLAAAIWDLVWAGRLTNDTLAPLRTVLGTGRPVADAGPGPGRTVSATARAGTARADGAQANGAQANGAQANGAQANGTQANGTRPAAHGPAATAGRRWTRQGSRAAPGPAGTARAAPAAGGPPARGCPAARAASSGSAGHG